MPGEIRLDMASGTARCDTCGARNFTDPAEPGYPTAIYALYIGAGYRQPSHLCPDCLDKLRLVLGPAHVGKAGREFDCGECPRRYS